MQLWRIAPLFAFAAFTAAAADDTSGKLPDGPGKATLEKVCTACHGAEIVMGRGLTKDGWTQIVQEMVQRGAQGSEEEFGQIVDYLAKNFPPEGEKPQSTSAASATPAKVNVNKATADDLKTALEVTADQAGAIVAYRQKNGDFKSIDDLKKVPGIDGSKLDAAKDKITFSD